jgi:hypothetical protein
MKTQLTRISPRQSSNVVSAFYALITLPLALTGLLMLLLSDNSDNTPVAVFLLLSPIVYGITAYLMAAVTFWLYNIVAKKIGGIEFSLVQIND